MVIVLRGNAASGKSTVALLLQDRLDRPAAILSQDHFRRSIDAEREQDSLAHADLLEAAALHCLGRGHGAHPSLWCANTTGKDVTSSRTSPRYEVCNLGYISTAIRGWGASARRGRDIGGAGGPYGQ